MSIVELKLSFPDMQARVMQNRDEIHLTLAAAMQTNRAMLFDSEGNYNGHEGWAPLKFREGMILSDRGTLRKSLAPRPATGQAGPDGIVELGADLVSVGTKLKYAAMMNWGTVGLPGGVLKPTKAKALAFPGPGGTTVFAKSVRIPARRFDTITSDDVAEFDATVTNKIMEILNR